MVNYDDGWATGLLQYYPLFRVRSWNNGVRCMSFCILLKSMSVKNKQYQTSANQKPCWKLLINLHGYKHWLLLIIQAPFLHTRHDKGSSACHFGSIISLIIMWSNIKWLGNLYVTLYVCIFLITYINIDMKNTGQWGPKTIKEHLF